MSENTLNYLTHTAWFGHMQQLYHTLIYIIETNLSLRMLAICVILCSIVVN